MSWPFIFGTDDQELQITDKTQIEVKAVSVCAQPFMRYHFLNLFFLSETGTQSYETNQLYRWCSLCAFMD